jgi:hypothetical protein
MIGRVLTVTSALTVPETEVSRRVRVYAGSCSHMLRRTTFATRAWLLLCALSPALADSNRTTTVKHSKMSVRRMFNESVGKAGNSLAQAPIEVVFGRCDERQVMVPRGTEKGPEAHQLRRLGTGWIRISSEDSSGGNAVVITCTSSFRERYAKLTAKSYIVRPSLKM